MSDAIISGYLIPSSKITELPFTFRGYNAIYNDINVNCKVSLTLIMDDKYWDEIWYHYLSDRFILINANRETVLPKTIIDGVHRSRSEVYFASYIPRNDLDACFSKLNQMYPPW